MSNRENWSRYEHVEPEHFWNRYRAQQVQLVIQGIQEHEQMVLPPVEEVQGDG